MKFTSTFSAIAFSSLVIVKATEDCTFDYMSEFGDVATCLSAKMSESGTYENFCAIPACVELATVASAVAYNADEECHITLDYENYSAESVQIHFLEFVNTLTSECSAYSSEVVEETPAPTPAVTENTVIVVEGEDVSPGEETEIENGTDEGTGSAMGTGDDATTEGDNSMPLEENEAETEFVTTASSASKVISTIATSALVLPAIAVMFAGWM